MVQKRSFLHSRRAQVTIFMIVGLLILFIAIFLISLTSSIKKEQLTGQQEKVFGNLFQKEGLRIGVEDCFHDILEEGIILLGKQGRIWSDQPGGTLEFVEGITGTTPQGSKDRIAYAITTETYPPDDTKSENPYPCDTYNKDQPCPYIFPDSHYGFGEIQLRKDTIEKDLLAYTTAQITPCVKELITSKTSSKVEIEPGQLDLQLKIENNGINVQVKYPLTLKLGGEELFHIADFDFFYDSLFKSFLDAAVVFPLQWDQKFVDFEYSESQLKTEKSTFNYASRKNIIGEKCSFAPSQTYFNCERKLFNEKFNSLDISLKKESQSNGDDIFVFTLPASNILEKMPSTYTFQFARQNRPPALDYINRSGCPEKEYDYLVVPGDEELENIDIQLHAKDADEDEVKEYRFDSVSALVKGDWPGPYIFDGKKKDYAGPLLKIESKYIQEPSSTPKIFSARVKDEHGVEDSQEIRVLIDRPIKTSFSIDMPYTISGKPYTEQFKDGKGYILSQEDPFLLTITVPDESKSPGVKQNVFLTYENDKPEKVNWEIPKDIPITKQETLIFPTQTKATDFNNLDISAFNNFPTFPSLFKTTTNKGKLTLSFSAAYCPDKEGKTKDAKTSQEATIQIKECIPHYDPLHLNPYIIGDKEEKYKLIFKDGKLTGEKNDKLSPFLATHKCCGKDWEIIKDQNIPCYTNPQPDCYRSALIEEEYEVCDGKRGNMCGDDNPHYQFPNNKLTCGGDSSICKTRNINILCKNADAFAIVTDANGKKGWCHGLQGCTDYCRELPRVYTGNDITLNGKIDITAKSLELLKNQNSINNKDLQLACGCVGNDGAICDSNLDGTFEGKCEKNICTTGAKP